MRATIDWLKEYIDFDWTPKDLALRLTMAGLEADVCDEIEGLAAIEVEITSNRSDWLSILGIAREIAALQRRKISLPKIKKYPRGKTDFQLEVKAGCTVRYFGLRIDEVKIAPSPEWLQKRLIACGIRPINNVVDITNYVMLLFGQPLHAFDFDKLEGACLIVRRARDKEAIVTLDGQMRALSKSDIVIADATRPVALAGIMGGENSEVSETTKRLLLESALFPRVDIRRTRQRLAITTEASYRFERGVDPVAVELACFYAANLIEELAHGKVVGYELYDEYKPEKVLIQVPIESLKRLSNVDVPAEEQKTILESLGFAVEMKENNLLVEVPSFRQDVILPEDILEEVLRIYGYDKVPVEVPKIGENSLRGKFSAREKILQAVKNILEARGFNEAISFSLISEREKKLFWEGAKLLKVENTISQDYLFLRPSALSGLLYAVKTNLSYGRRWVCLYEICQSLSQEDLCQEHLILSAVTVDKDLESAFRRIKRVVEDLFAGQEINITRGKDNRFSSFSKVLINNKEVGFFGKLRNRISREYDIKDVVFYLEIDFELYLELVSQQKRIYHPISQFPAVERDISMWINPEKVGHQEIVRAIIDAGGEHLHSIKLIDVYHAPDGRISYAYRLYFCSSNRTLKEEEIDPVFNDIIQALDKTGVEVRKI